MNTKNDEQSNNNTSNKFNGVKEAKHVIGSGPVLEYPTPHHGIGPAKHGEQGWERKPK